MESDKLNKKFRKRKQIRLQERDIFVIKLITNFGYVTADIVQKLVFKTSRKSTRRRLYALEQAGYLDSIYRNDHLTACKLYIPNKELSRSLDREDLPQLIKTMQARPWLRTSTVHEDMVRHWATKIQLFFPNASIKLDYQQDDFFSRPTSSSNESYFMRPDMDVNLDSDTHFQIEIELNSKSHQRYQKKIYGIFDFIFNVPVIYLTNDSTITNKIQENINTVYEKLKYRSRSHKNRVQVFHMDDIKTKDEFLKIIGHGLQRDLRQPGHSNVSIENNKSEFENPKLEQ